MLMKNKFTFYEWVCPEDCKNRDSIFWWISKKKRQTHGIEVIQQESNRYKLVESLKHSIEPFMTFIWFRNGSAKTLFYQLIHLAFNLNFNFKAGFELKKLDSNFQFEFNLKRRIKSQLVFNKKFNFPLKFILIVIFWTTNTGRPRF